MTSNLTRVALFSFLLICFIPNSALAEVKTFIKEYTCQASKIDRKVSSRITAIREVKRLLLEEIGTYLERETEVKNFQLTKEQMTALTAGIVKTEVIDEKWNGEIYWIRTKIIVDTDHVIKSIDALRKDGNKSRQLEITKKRADVLLQENKKLREELVIAKGNEKQKVQQRYDHSIKELLAIEWFESGNIYYVKGDYKTAIRHYCEAMELNPEDVFWHGKLGDTYYALGKYDEAIVDFSKAIEINPKDVLLYTKRGDAYYAFGKYDKAIVDFSQAIGLHPQGVWLYTKRGDTYYAFGKYNEAIVDFSKAIEFNPKEALLYARRGDAYYAFGKYNEAIVDFSNIMELQPKQAVFYNSRGYLYDEIGKHNEAIVDYGKAIELDPDLPYPYMHLGVHYNRLGKYNKAINHLNKAIELSPLYEDAYYVRACSYSMTSNIKRSIQDLKQAVKIKPTLRNDAKNDKYFDNIKDMAEFKRLIY